MEELTIKRVSLPSEVVDAVKYDMNARLAASVDTIRQARSKEAELLKVTLAPLISTIESHPEAVSALKELREIRSTSRPLVSLRSSQTTDLHSDHRHSIAFPAAVEPYQFTVVGHPFDTDWTDSRGNKHGSRYADRESGAFGIDTDTVMSDWASLSAGIGAAVTTSQVVNARVTADVYYDYAWADSASLIVAHTRGLLGILIYETDENGQVTIANDSRHELWSDGAAWLDEDDGGGRGFLQAYLYDVAFTMIPGRRYLIWTWCWGESDGEHASCRINAQLYFLAISASPR